MFCYQGILVAVEWFRQRGHQEITVFLPQWRGDANEGVEPHMRADREALQQLESDKIIVWMPSKKTTTG